MQGSDRIIGARPLPARNVQGAPERTVPSPPPHHPRLPAERPADGPQQRDRLIQRGLAPRDRKRALRALSAVHGSHQIHRIVRELRCVRQDKRWHIAKSIATRGTANNPAPPVSRDTQFIAISVSSGPSWLKKLSLLSSSRERKADAAKPTGGPTMITQKRTAPSERHG